MPGLSRADLCVRRQWFWVPSVYMVHALTLIHFEIQVYMQVPYLRTYFYSIHMNIDLSLNLGDSWPQVNRFYASKPRWSYKTLDDGCSHHFNAVCSHHIHSSPPHQCQSRGIYTIWLRQALLGNLNNISQAHQRFSSGPDHRYRIRQCVRFFRSLFSVSLPFESCSNYRT